MRKIKAAENRSSHRLNRAVSTAERKRIIHDHCGEKPNHNQWQLEEANPCKALAVD